MHGADASGAARGPLWVELAGNRTVASGPSLTFGRAADVVIDDANRYLHRIAGRFVLCERRWWLQSVGRSIHFDVGLAGDSGSRLHVASGDQVPLPAGEFTVTFAAGGATYELECGSTSPPGPGELSVPLDAQVGERTLDFGIVPLTLEQRMLCIALAEWRLSGRDLIPTSARLGTRLGWGVRKVNRKLDNVCVKFAKAGVPGLVGEVGDQASQRRRLLVDHLVRFGVVTNSDLALLDSVDCATAVGVESLTHSRHPNRGR